MPLEKVRLLALREQAHHLTPAVRLGADGVTQGIVLSLESRFKRAELVKLQCGKATPVTSDEAADNLSKATKSDVVQVIGRTFTLFRAKNGVAPAVAAPAAATPMMSATKPAPAKPMPAKAAPPKPVAAVKPAAPKAAPAKAAAPAKPAAPAEKPKLKAVASKAPAKSAAKPKKR
jgi:putative YhbY family RNA-binding protein